MNCFSHVEDSSEVRDEEQQQGGRACDCRELALQHIMVQQDGGNGVALSVLGSCGRIYGVYVPIRD
jgi:hypothetical protein